MASRHSDLAPHRWSWQLPLAITVVSACADCTVSVSHTMSSEEACVKHIRRQTEWIESLGEKRERASLLDARREATMVDIDIKDDDGTRNAHYVGKLNFDAAALEDDKVHASQSLLGQVPLKSFS